MKSTKIEVKCFICGKPKLLKRSDVKNNKTGHFYCGRECLGIGHKQTFSGENNPFYGKTHSEDTKIKISGKNHWNYGNRKLEKAKSQYTFTCNYCDKEFISSTPKRKFCSNKCIAKANYPDKITRNCSYCGNQIQTILCKANNSNMFCNTECYALYRKFIYDQPSGPNSHWYGKRGNVTPNWRGGISYEPYGSDFDEELKESIRKRDEYTCQLCGKIQEDEKLSIHHIDYNKKNIHRMNLISLCRACHVRTNGDRDIWIDLFRDLISNKYISKKVQRLSLIGSTLQANGNGSAGHPIKIKDDDIVCSSWKHEAAEKRSELCELR